MRARGVAWLALLVAVVLAAGLAAVGLLPERDEGTPERTAARYFAAWSRGALGRMRGLAADPPDDFAEQHRALTSGLQVNSIALEAGPVVRSGPDEARAGFTVTRDLAGRGDWTYRSVLRLGRVHHKWRVLWSPATLYPGLKGKGAWTLGEVRVPSVRLVARNGAGLPDDGPLQPYLAGLTDRLDGEEETGWAVVLRDGNGPPRRLKLFGVKGTEKIRTTLDARVQAAAERVVGERAAAVVALRPSSGDVLAVADGLGGLGAFGGHYPPGSTFKVVTAAALLDGGMDAGSGAECPAVVTTAQRTIRNDGDHAVAGATLRDAFAQSCNTTFARLAVDELGPAKLAAAARAYGFGAATSPGVPAWEGGFPDPGGGAGLAEAAIGQGRVEATPLLMAAVAAAVADGTWRPPRLLDAGRLRGGRAAAEAHPVPGADALRGMMRAVVTGGTAARAGLPAGTAGKTGTAESPQGTHAWFIGYRGDLAFCVFVQGGGSGPDVAAPLAARFLRALG